MFIERRAFFSFSSGEKDVYVGGSVDRLSISFGFDERRRKRNGGTVSRSVGGVSLRNILKILAPELKIEETGGKLVIWYAEEGVVNKLNKMLTIQTCKQHLNHKGEHVFSGKRSMETNLVRK